MDRSTWIDKTWAARHRPVPTEELPTLVEEDLFADTLRSGLFPGEAPRDLAVFKNEAEALTDLLSNSGKHYEVLRPLTRSGGEGAILLVQDDAGQTLVAKVFSSSDHAPQAAVLRYMNSPEGMEYTLPIFDFGNVLLEDSTHCFEISPYCPEGDLSQGPPLSFEEIVDLARRMNRALKTMHDCGIYHRDIKPSNMFRLMGRIVLGDFGIAKTTVVGTHRAGTIGYQAPETVMALTEENLSVYNEASDYYSLGISLAALHAGRYPYDGLPPEAMILSIQSGQPPLRQDEHLPKLENLIFGLCAFDPAQRFSFTDVEKWLANHSYSGQIRLGYQWPRPLEFLGQACRDEKSLFLAITRDEGSWAEGRRRLYRKHFESFFRPFHSDHAACCERCDEVYRLTDPDLGLFIFLKDLYPPGPLVWMGRTFESLGKLSEAMRTPDDLCRSLLKKGVVSRWMEQTKGLTPDPTTLALVKQIEALVQSQADAACYMFANSFGAPALALGETVVRDIPGLIRTLFASPRSLAAQSFDRQEGAALYGFLYSFGYLDLINEVFRTMEGLDDFQRACGMYHLFEFISEKEVGADPGPVRQLFRRCGPVGIAACVQALVRQGDVYTPLDSRGRQALDAVAGYSLPQTGSADELLQSAMPLFKLIGDMRSILCDNPFLLCSGIHPTTGILCTRMKGSFCLIVYGMEAPMAFNTIINEGGN